MNIASTNLLALMCLLNSLSFEMIFTAMTGQSRLEEVSETRSAGDYQAAHRQRQGHGQGRGGEGQGRLLQAPKYFFILLSPYMRYFIGLYFLILLHCNMKETD